MNNPRRKVLLAVRDGHVAPRLLAAAQNLCERMDAELDILARFGGAALPPSFESFLEALRVRGLAYTVTIDPGLRRRDVVRYANSHECVCTVVIDSIEAWEAVAADGGGNPWEHLACPLVTAALPQDEGLAQ